MKKYSFFAIVAISVFITYSIAIAAESQSSAIKWDLWVDGPHLRGANTFQRRIYLELDGAEFMGPGPLGPPYTQADFDLLAAWGANFVNISHPGLFSENPPYEVDLDVQENLDTLLEMIKEADMFAVISFRTGPGRSEFGLCCFEEVGDWYDESYLNNEVWRDENAQEAWSKMWAYTAQRYKDNPIVVGYDLMVEPNSNEIWLDEWDQEVFYAEYANTLYDWNQLYPKIVSAIRKTDSSTPIIVGGMAYSSIDWLPWIEPIDDVYVIYAAHQYAPHGYTHQWRDSDYSYPGEMDLDWDNRDDPFNRAWLENELFSIIDSFVSNHDVAVTVNEFGLIRWVPGAAAFVADEIELLEARGINHALWQWQTSWEQLQEENDAFNFRHGPDPDHHEDVSTSDLIEVIKSNWSKNTHRPSNTTFANP
ncbi:MAG: cellulase family glycosylhydrolase [Anaerolineales bacterium]|nr:cellulase family glycosylhydrolase [Chloroflexota bacterium]MBL6981000.1 cellulase family glycosylhydrolase [Anaerolineales bacterium]